MEEHNARQSSLVLVASDSLHAGAGLTVAVLSHPLCHVAGIVGLASARKMRRAIGAALTIAWCPNPDDWRFAVDDDEHSSTFVRTIVLSSDPSVRDAPILEGVETLDVDDEDDAVESVRALLFALSGEDRLPLSRRVDHSSAAHELLGNLTAREIEILTLTAEGHSLEETAQIISRSLSTVATHRRSIMLKTGLRDRVALTRFAIKLGLARL